MRSEAYHAKRRERYRQNRERILAQCKAYRDRNAGACRERSRNYFRDHREQCKNSQKNWYQKNKERICALRKMRYHTDLEASRQLQRKQKREWRKRPEVKEMRRRECHLQYKKNPDVQRRHWLKSRYRMKMEDYEALLSEQNGVCGICSGKNKQPSRWKTEVRYLHVDHCHKSKRIRGLLCHNCNAGLGHFKDDIALLRKAIEYLKRNS